MWVSPSGCANSDADINSRSSQTTLSEHNRLYHHSWITCGLIWAGQVTAPNIHATTFLFSPITVSYCSYTDHSAVTTVSFMRQVLTQILFQAKPCNQNQARPHGSDCHGLSAAEISDSNNCYGNIDIKVVVSPRKSRVFGYIDICGTNDFIQEHCGIRNFICCIW